MELNKKQNTIKYVLYCVLILLADLLQNTGGLITTIFSAHCFLLIPVTITLAMSEGEKEATLLGLFGGLLWDMVSADHLGFNSIFLALFCLLASYITENLVRNVYIVNLLVSVAGVFIYSVLYWVLFVASTKDTGSFATLGYYYIPCAIYTSVISILAVYLINLIRKNLLKNLEKIA